MEDGFKTNADVVAYVLTIDPFLGSSDFFVRPLDMFPSELLRISFRLSIQLE